jgi:TRAP-type C4-dicarboxylate transport system permease small subunit
MRSDAVPARAKPLAGPLMKALGVLCGALARAALVLAGAALAGLGLVVIYGVVMRYAFNAAPAFVEQVALLLVICVAMFGASVGVRERGHIGLDSVVKLLPAAARHACALLAEGLVLAFALVLVFGSAAMCEATWPNDIPTLGISEACRYVPPLLAGALVSLFCIERLLALALDGAD